MTIEINDTITFKLNGKLRTYTITHSATSDPEKGELSFGAPLAQQILGRKEGDVVCGQVPAGQVVINIIKVEKLKKVRL